MADALVADRDSATIVLLGNFNPAIFQPAWFDARQLLSYPEATAAAAGVRIISPSFTEFSTEWLTLSVTTERFMATAADAAYFEAVRDLTIGTFQLLEHTPTTALGLNRDMHFPVKDEARWHELGDRLAPKEFWRTKLAGRRGRSVPGLGSMRIEGRHPDSVDTVYNVTVEPSARIDPGLYIGVNSPRRTADFPTGLTGLMDELSSEWTGMLDYSLQIASMIMEEV